jgi:hypothetical protein
MGTTLYPRAGAAPAPPPPGGRRPRQVQVRLRRTHVRVSRLRHDGDRAGAGGGTRRLRTRDAHHAANTERPGASPEAGRTIPGQGGGPLPPLSTLRASAWQAGSQPASPLLMPSCGVRGNALETRARAGEYEEGKPWLAQPARNSVRPRDRETPHRLPLPFTPTRCSQVHTSRDEERGAPRGCARGARRACQGIRRTRRMKLLAGSPPWGCDQNGRKSVPSVSRPT